MHGVSTSDLAGPALMSSAMALSGVSSVAGVVPVQVDD